MRPTEHSVPTPAGTLLVHAWAATHPTTVVVTVHPWAPLGGSEHNTVGYGRALPEALPGTAVLTFNMRSSSMIWGVLTGHKSEVAQVQAVCEWAEKTYSGARLLLLGSSAGAPVAGSALDRTNAAGGIFVGYTFGRFASIGFGSHFGACLRSEKPKLFLQGETDEFTSPDMLRSKVAAAKGANAVHIFEGIGHFQLEHPSFDAHICGQIVDWCGKTWAGGCGASSTPSS